MPRTPGTSTLRCRGQGRTGRRTHRPATPSSKDPSGTIDEVRQTTDEQFETLKTTVERVAGLPPESLETYARLWQLETWLRRMVYVELRALAGDQWASRVNQADKASRSLTADKRLTHMPTPASTILSYAQLADLETTIGSNWPCFMPYLPPRTQWDARLEEVKQVRHRVAHFRPAHRDDLPRVTQLLRDIDEGVWHFCTSYNDAHPILPPEDDPVVTQFLHLDPFPWSPNPDGAWSRRGIADPHAMFGMTVGVLRRPWVTEEWPNPVAGTAGYLYDVRIHARQQREFNCKQFLEDTRPLHANVALIHPEGTTGVRVTIPALLGHEAVSDAITTLISWIPNALIPTIRCSREDVDEQLAAEWPEYVIGPQDPMSFLCPDMPCSFFEV